MLIIGARPLFGTIKTLGLGSKFLLFQEILDFIFLCLGLEGWVFIYIKVWTWSRQRFSVIIYTFIILIHRSENRWIAKLLFKWCFIFIFLDYFDHIGHFVQPIRQSYTFIIIMAKSIWKGKLLFNVIGFLLQVLIHIILRQLIDLFSWRIFSVNCFSICEHFQAHGWLNSFAVLPQQFGSLVICKVRQGP